MLYIAKQFKGRSTNILQMMLQIFRKSFSFSRFFKINNVSNIVSESRFLFGVKIWPPALNSLSTNAEDGRRVLYCLNTF